MLHGAECEGMALGAPEGVENWNSENVGSEGLNEIMLERADMELRVLNNEIFSNSA